MVDEQKLINLSFYSLFWMGTNFSSLVFLPHLAFHLFSLFLLSRCVAGEYGSKGSESLLLYNQNAGGSGEQPGCVHAFHNLLQYVCSHGRGEGILPRSHIT